jgi:hypothetical protein
MHTTRHECSVGGAGAISWSQCACGWQSEGFWDRCSAVDAYSRHVSRSTPLLHRVAS